MTGRGFGRCLTTSFSAERLTSLERERKSPQTAEARQETVRQTPVYGLGRGGNPYGYGRRRGFGGNGALSDREG